MKQTVEKAAISFANKCRIANIKGGLDYPYDELDMRNAFEEGVNWQSKQSPWISVEERLPEYPCWVLVTGKEYKYRILFYCGGKFYTDKSLTSYDGSVLFWIPIPSLDKDL